MKNGARKSSKLVIAIKLILRVVLVTIVFTLMAFAIGLFFGIFATLAFGALRHVHPDMTMAYKFVAAPFAVIALVITFFVMLTTEIRRLRGPLSLRRTS